MLPKILSTDTKILIVRILSIGGRLELKRSEPSKIDSRYIVHESRKAAWDPLQEKQSYITVRNSYIECMNPRDCILMIDL